jgi:hypothetical protein
MLEKFSFAFLRGSEGVTKPENQAFDSERDSWIFKK